MRMVEELGNADKGLVKVCDSCKDIKDVPLR